MCFQFSSPYCDLVLFSFFGTASVWLKCSSPPFCCWLRRSVWFLQLQPAPQSLGMFECIIKVLSVCGWDACLNVCGLKLVSWWVFVTYGVMVCPCCCSVTDLVLQYLFMSCYLVFTQLCMRLMESTLLFRITIIIMLFFLVYDDWLKYKWVVICLFPVCCLLSLHKWLK